MGWNAGVLKSFVAKASVRTSPQNINSVHLVYSAQKPPLSKKK